MRLGRWVGGVWEGMGFVHTHMHNSFTRFHLWWGGTCIKQFSIQPNPTYLSTLNHPYLVSIVYADLLSLHLVTFFILVIIISVTHLFCAPCS